MPKKVIGRVRLTTPQEATLIRLNRLPRKSGAVREVTATSLVRKGYLHQLQNGLYELTQAGIRYNQTGKEIGE